MERSSFLYLGPVITKLIGRKIGNRSEGKKRRDGKEEDNF